MWDGLFDKDDNIVKNPLYYRSTLDIEKSNKELKRSLNTMIKFKDDSKSQDFLSMKDFVALEKGIAAYEKLLFKRDKALSENKERAAKKKRKELRGTKWIMSNFKKVDISFMLNVIYADNLNHRFFNYYDDEIETCFNDVLAKWGVNMESKEDAAEHVIKLYAALEDVSHENYTIHTNKVAEALAENIKTGE